MSDFDENLKALLVQLAVITDITKGASNEISEFLEKGESNEVTRKNITEKLLNFTNSLNEETVTAKDKYSKLTSSNQNDVNVNKQTSSTETASSKSNTPEENEDDNTDQVEGNPKNNFKEENKENETKVLGNDDIKRPMLKIVDFSKLVDPRNLELMDKNHKRKERNKDLSVIILSSSDDENTSKTRSVQKLNRTDSRSSRSTNSKVQKPQKNSVTNKKHSVRETKTIQIVSQILIENKDKNKLKEKSMEEYISKYLNEDEKLRKKPYIKLLRVPCEQMKSFYLEKSGQNSNVKAASSLESDQRKKSSEAILDEKTGELIQNSSSNEEELENSSSGKKKQNEHNSKKKKKPSSVKDSKNSETFKNSSKDSHSSDIASISVHINEKETLDQSGNKQHNKSEDEEQSSSAAKKLLEEKCVESNTQKNTKKKIESENEHKNERLRSRLGITRNSVNISEEISDTQVKKQRMTRSTRNDNRKIKKLDSSDNEKLKSKKEKKESRKISSSDDNSSDEEIITSKNKKQGIPRRPNENKKKTDKDSLHSSDDDESKSKHLRDEKNKTKEIEHSSSDEDLKKKGTCESEPKESEGKENSSEKEEQSVDKESKSKHMKNKRHKAAEDDSADKNEKNLELRSTDDNLKKTEGKVESEPKKSKAKKDSSDIENEPDDEELVSKHLGNEENKAGVGDSVDEIRKNVESGSSDEDLKEKEDNSETELVKSREKKNSDETNQPAEEEPKLKNKENKTTKDDSSSDENVALDEDSKKTEDKLESKLKKSKGKKNSNKEKLPADEESKLKNKKNMSAKDDSSSDEHVSLDEDLKKKEDKSESKLKKNKGKENSDKEKQPAGKKSKSKHLKKKKNEDAEDDSSDENGKNVEHGSSDNELKNKADKLVSELKKSKEKKKSEKDMSRRKDDENSCEEDNEEHKTSNKKNEKDSSTEKEMSQKSKLKENEAAPGEVDAEDNLSSEENLSTEETSVTDKKSKNGKEKKKRKESHSDEDTKSDQGKSSSKKTASENLSDEDMFSDNGVETRKEKDSSEKETNKKTYILSDSEEDEPIKKEAESSESDTEKKRKRRKNKASEEDVITINSEDSDDFGTFCVKNKRTRNDNKKVKRLASDSEEDETEKSKKSESEYEDDTSGDDSGDGSSNSEEEKKEGDRKRRRIKQIKDDSSDSDNKVTRKKIKKVISKDSLSDKTKQAVAEEKERRQRILEKQKKYNQIFEGMDLASSKVDKLVLDVDEKTEKPLLEVDKDLVSKLKPHQASGIQFMWNACFESLQMAKSKEGSGCILAHCMGLGKTLQVIALAHTLLESAEETKIRKILVVTPLSTVLNWKAEFKNWLSGDEDFEVFELITCRSLNADRALYVKQWHQNGGIMIISYAMFRNLSNDNNKKVSKKFRTTFYEGLVDPGPDLVVCDEGHLLKNEKTGLSIAMNKIKTRRRIVLTGTPLQNNLKEYYCMVQFVKPNLLGTYREYLNRFVNPITNGQYTDSTEYDINIMRRRSHVLHKLLEGIVQRRDYSVLAPYLPPKFEYVLFLTLSDTQKKLYSHYLQHFARKSKDGSNRTSYLFQDFQAFSRICIHPRVLLDKSTEDQMKFKSDDEESVGSLKDFIDDESDASTSESSESGSGSGSASEKKQKKKTISRRVTRAQKAEKKSDDETTEEEVLQPEKQWWQEYCDEEELNNLGHGTKIRVLFEILKECEQIGDKVLVFSQSLYALNVIEYFLERVDEATQNGDADKKTCGYTGSWAPGLDYFRLDGSTNCSLRTTWCDSFNKESNTRARLFLLSTRAGGLGINLVGANRVIIFDVSWNPSSDIQSIYRVYRFGQLKPSYIYRFVINETMEMKIYERQVIKQAISKRVIDEQQIDRHYNQNDLAELYKFEPDPEDRPIPLVPKDVLLGELLQHHSDKIFKYHEHQTLLENKEDETLNEEERKAAWDEFENEKVERTKQTLIGKFSIPTVQLALKSIIQRDNPTWNNKQILSIIPQLIEQLNFQLEANDTTMYNRVAAEVRRMQDEHSRRMQMQFMQYRMQLEAQRQQFGGQQFAGQQFAGQQFGGFPNRFPNPFFSQFQQFMGNRQNVQGASTSSNHDVVELN